MISPKVSFIIPTLNSQKVLESCLSSIKKQNYPNFEIIISDGGSTDNTLKIAIKYKCKIIKNGLKTAEAGKATGLKNARGKFVAFIDSDNILPDVFWLKSMLLPFSKHTSVIGSEPDHYTYRKKGGYIERYSSLTGVNDPYTLVAGNYDRRNYIRRSWTSLKLNITDFPEYQIAQFSSGALIPTIGANGTIFKKSFLDKYFKGKYFFDIDILSLALSKSKQPLYFAKVKIGIIHSFCESSIIKFFNKQKRRAIDLYTFQNLRHYPLANKSTLYNFLFILYVITLFPMIIDTLRGFSKKPDIAWFFHPLACIITLFNYGLFTILHFFGLLKPLNRSHWSQ